VADRIHFALNRDILSARSAAVLQGIAAVLLKHPGARIELRGNADERGDETFNKVLSRQRAEVVRTYLIAAGIQRSRISVSAFGTTAPDMRGNDRHSFARNRRVEFVFSGIDSIRVMPQYEDLQIEKVRE
jgi:outer membrane protein OmpA-like peptidoglycan-associated protein